VLRLFLDANVLFLAGYSTTSPVHDLLQLARARHCQLVASAYAIEEARRNLAAKVPTDALPRFHSALAVVTLVGEAAPAALEAASAIGLADPADVPILAAAIQSGADVLVTGDRRAFGPYFGTRLAGVEVLALRDTLRRVLGLET
jgi:predicted nucleic acid-binding protein